MKIKGKKLAVAVKALDSSPRPSPQRGEGDGKGKGAMSGLGGSLALPVRPADSELVQAARDSIAVVRNVRKTFNQEKLQELADSIRAHGILQPLVVRPRSRFTLLEPDLVCYDWRVVNAETKEVVDSMPRSIGVSEALMTGKWKELNQFAYELVAGERRLRAAELAGLTQVPCMVRAMTDAEVRAIHRIENLQREDITALEEAQGFRDWMDEEKITADEVAERIQKSRSHVFARLKLLKLTPPVREAVLAGTIPQSIGELIARVPGEAQQVKALKAIAEGNEFWDEDKRDTGTEPLSFREARKLIEQEYRVALKGAKFDRTAEYAGYLTVCPGACEGCQWRSGNMKEEFPEIGSPDICTNPEGFRQKEDAALKWKADQAEQAGDVVLKGKEAKGLFRVEYDYHANKEKTVLKSDKWVELKGTVPGDKKERSWKELFKDSPEAVQRVAFDTNGKRHVLVPMESALAAAKESGVKVATAQERSGQTQRNRQEQEQKRKERKEALAKIGNVALGQMRTAAGKMKLDVEFLRMLAIHQTSYATLDRYGLRNDAKLEKEAKVWGETELKVFLFECALVGEIVTWEGQFAGTFKSAAELCGVDLKAVEKGLAEGKGTPELAKGKKGKGKK